MSGGRRRVARPVARSTSSARAVAIDALLRIEEGAYANIVLPHLLERSALGDADRRFVT